jgi:hypothetical protein
MVHVRTFLGRFGDHRMTYFFKTNQDRRSTALPSMKIRLWKVMGLSQNRAAMQGGLKPLYQVGE